MIKIFLIMLKNKICKLFSINRMPKDLMGILHFMYKSGAYPFLPRMICRDGFSLSIQYSEFCYRDTNTLELGFLSSEELLLDDYKDDEVYPYVPISLVAYIVDHIHGGVVKFKDFKGTKKKNMAQNMQIPNCFEILPLYKETI